MMTSSRLQKRHRLTAVICLVLHLGCGSKVLPGMAVMLAEADGSHAVAVVPEADGIEVRLSHERCLPNHHHGILARMACLMAVPVADQDHHLHFVAPSTILKVEEREGKTGAARQSLDQEVSIVECGWTCQSVMAAVESRRDAWRLQDFSRADTGLIRHLRTTVLLV